MFSTPRILIVDDEPRMRDSLKSLLSSQDYEISTANSGQEALDLLSKQDFDVALLDIVMPDMSGHQLMDHINVRNPDTLVIVITGHATLDSAVDALRRGAYDYVRKPFDYDELLKRVQNALNQKRLKYENGVINGELALTEERYRYLVQNSPDIIYALDHKGNFTFVNNSTERLLGFKVEELVGKSYTHIVYEEDLEKAKWFFNERRTRDRATSGIELRLTKCNNANKFRHTEFKNLTIELKSTGMYDKPVKEKDKIFLGTHGVARDISDRRQLEAQLQHAQRMEALGTLAGGIAHDFNNLLMGIQGNTSLIFLETDPYHPNYERLKNVEQSVRSGAELTRQLLGFARGGKYEVKPIDLNEVVKKTSDMFSRTKKEIKIHEKHQRNIWKVEADRGQIEQVLLNLYVNAWQAMPGGGDLYLETENVVLDADYVRPHQMEPGNYVKASVTDTGVGMGEKTMERIFEPFFTTKEMGRGTGLGLASVYGIIKNHGGFITIYSEKGKGSTFNIFLPATSLKGIEESLESEEQYEMHEGEGSVLLVDDEDMIVDVGQELLETLGYDVFVARNGKEAIEVCREKKDGIDLVLLDMIMPEMSGGETYDRLKAINPEIKVLLSSGYSINGEATEILERGCNGFIQKPFSIKELYRQIRKILT